MKKSSILPLFSFVLALLSLSWLSSPASSEDLKALGEELTSRAQVLESMLEDHFCVLPPISDRTFWESLSKESAYRYLIRAAEKDLQTPVPVVPDELYLQFSQNGNRTNYQNAYNRRNAPLSRLVLAECFENQGRFIPRIEEQLKAYFSDRSWVLPAHDRNLQNFNGKYDVDLVSSAAAWNLATIDAILGDRLSPEVRKELDHQLNIRCFEPFRSSILTGTPKLWWVRGINNWNAVCLAGVVGAALTHLDSKEERAWFLAAGEKFIQNSNRGYAEDGYCTEGVGYWCYGFGNHTRLSETVRRATNGKIHILDQPKLRKVALYGFTIEILPGFSPSFADCGMKAKPDYRLLGFLNRCYGFHLDSYDFTLPSYTQNLVDLGIFGMNLPTLPSRNEKGIATASASDSLPEISNQTWFSEAQILILRPEGWKSAASDLSDSGKTLKAVESLNGFAAAMKGGHNAEEHNHNDVGTYVLIYRGTLPALDLGGEVYTRRTFSAQRYDSDVLNSWGHNVPVVAGQLQKTGRSHCATVLKSEFNSNEDLFEIDFSAAYDVKECQKLTRKFVYSRTESRFSVQDDVQFSSPQTFEVPMITIQSWKQNGESVIFGDGQSAVRAEIEVTVDGKVSHDWTIQESRFEADFQAKDSARRLGIVLKQPVSSATVRITYTPVSSRKKDK